MVKIVGFVRQASALLERNMWLPALVGRLAMAGEFIPSGFGKLTHLPKAVLHDSERKGLFVRGKPC